MLTVGKTETTKKVLTYLANVAPGARKASKNEPGIEDKILQSNPLLEALGNAKTLRNNNSSRFGKWMKVDFDHDFRIQGCEIVNYLLEKSRVVIQTKGERNYHIFYQLIAGSDPALKARLRLGGIDDYRLLTQSGCSVIEDVDDAAEFRDVIAALVTLQFYGDFSESMFKIMSAILHLGNVEFITANEVAAVSPSSLATLGVAAELLGVELAQLNFALTEKRVQMGKGEVVNIKNNAAQAVDSKDTLSKALYSNLFDCVVKRVNETLKVSEAPFSIGILDIFGFEIFDDNSFEQLSINYANEKLQLHFNEVIFNEELKMYTEEGIPSEAIQFEDNAECVSLIEGKPMGLLSLLDEECSLGKATDLTYISKIDGVFSKGKQNENKFFLKNKTKPNMFTVIHFAGPVEYNVNGFLEKNRDTLSTTLQEAMCTSAQLLIAQLFAVSEPAAGGKQKGANAKLTLGGQFRNQLIGLVANLKLTEPHFIRCVKPNHLKRARIFDGQLILRQLRYAGLFEAIRIRKSGFAYRVTHAVFCHQYALLVDGVQTRLKDGKLEVKEAAQIILEEVTKQGLLGAKVWFVGVTKIFIKTNHDRILLDRERQKRVLMYALRIQAFGRQVLDFIQRNKAAVERKRKEAAAAALLKEQNRVATLFQKVLRGFLVRRAMMLMQELVKLRKHLAARDVASVENTLHLIERRGGDMLPAAFQHEVKMAKTMVKLILIQDKFIKSVEKALVAKSVPDLNRLLVKGDRLDLSDHPTVVRAKTELGRLHQKRKVMVTMIEFLRSENDHCEIIPETLEAAEELGVDPDFIAKVQRVYDSASPRLRARNKLRRAVELVDKVGMIEGCQEVEELQKHHPRFAEMELRAAKSMLRMIEMESVLHVPEVITPKKNAKSAPPPPPFVIPTGPRLTDEIIALCQDITACSVSGDRALLKSLKNRLTIRIAGENAEMFEMLVRSYKWSKIFCAWKYPEVQPSIKKAASLKAAKGDSDSASAEQDSPEMETMSDIITAQDEGEFFGLRPGEARFSKYIVRALHRDVDPQSGDAPASIQAALGAIEAAYLDPSSTDFRRIQTDKQASGKLESPKIAPRTKTIMKVRTFNS